MRIKKVIAAAVCVIGAGAGAGYIYQRIGLTRDRRRFTAPGRLIDCGGHRLHLVESGSGRPAVVLESGIAASSLSWSLVQPEVAKFARVCSYDRAGFGWSEAHGGVLALRGLVENLRGALREAAIPCPIVMVGHSFGGLIARAYAAWYPDEVLGLVLVDPVLPEEWVAIDEKQRRLLALGVRLSRRGAWLARFGAVRLSLALLALGATRIAQWIVRFASGKGSSVAGRLVGEVQKLPRALWPVIQAHWSDAKSFETMAAYLQALPASAAAVEEERKPDGIPLTILSAAKATSRQRKEWDVLAARGDPGTHLIAARSGHWIPFDEPELVVEAVREMVARTALP